MEVAEPGVKELKMKRSPARRFDFIWNFLTFIVVVVAVSSAAYFAFLYFYPTSTLNPFPPKALPAALVLPSPTRTYTPLPPTKTPTITGTPTPEGWVAPTDTPTITLSPTITETPVPVTPSSTLPGPIPTDTPNPLFSPTATEKVNPYYPFAVQGMPEPVAVSIFSPERDCKWLGVGGRVVDLKGQPVIGIIVEIGGYLNRKAVSQTSLTGLALQYGQSGYEFKLADGPEATRLQPLWIHLVDQANLPLSPKVYFDTYADCQLNQILINFKQVR
jgi:hypothetical protein